VWIVDPLDGTREFIEGIPEWSVSVGLVEDGAPVAGGVLNPATDELVIGAVGHGVTLNGTRVGPGDRPVQLDGARVLASRSEVARGEWDRYRDAGFEVVPCGSVAYKLGQVAAGLADATWTLVPKHEWDVAGGAALIRAAGLHLSLSDGSARTFNSADPKLPNFLAGPAQLLDVFRARWVDTGDHARAD
jgi:myo-inositol-1(or 4)-monophosphatase